MAKESFFESVKTEFVNTVSSYFAPVKAVINEVSKAVVTESKAIDTKKE